MQVKVYNIKGEATDRTVDLPAEVFGIEPHEHSVWLDVKRYLAAQRQGTHKSKERNELTGSTRKLHKQKGTGGSRKGDINSPTFRGGARVFGPRPRNYDIKVNAKVRSLARRSALSAKAAAGSIVIVEDFTFDAPKTKDFKAIIGALQMEGKRLLTVIGEHDKMVYLSGRNLQKVVITPAKDLNTYQIMQAGIVVIAESAIKGIQENCAPE
ncbi:MAG: 50S ribosomal protein L4 [Saprospiraceae bacterium]